MEPATLSDLKDAYRMAIARRAFELFLETKRENPKFKVVLLEAMVKDRMGCSLRTVQRLLSFYDAQKGKMGRI